MQVAVRPSFTAAGVALVGASVFAASAISPMPDIHLPSVSLPAMHSVEVGLAALANPLETYAKVFQDAVANVNTLAANTVPFQVLNQIIANQIASATTLVDGLQTTGGAIADAVAQVPAQLTNAVTQLAAGNLAGAVNTLLGIPLAVVLPATNLIPALAEVLTKPLQNIVNVVNSFANDSLGTLLAISGFIAPLISTTGAVVTAVQNVLDAVGTGDLGAVANAVLTAPATVIDGALNGGYGPDLGPLVQPGVAVFAGGLLSSPEISIGPDGLVLKTGGPFNAIQQILQKITAALTPPAAATADIAAIPVSTAATVTLTNGGEAVKTGTETPSVSATSAGTQTAAATQTPPAKEGTAAAAEVTTDAPAAKAPESTSGSASTKAGSETDAATVVSTKESTTEDTTTKDTTTKDTTAKDTATESSPAKEPTKTDVDVKTGNKVEPKTAAGADAPKAGDTKDATSTGEPTGTAASSAAASTGSSS